MWEGICNWFDGHVPGSGPVTTRLDLLCQICASKRDLCSSDMDNILLGGNMVEIAKDDVKVNGFSTKDVSPF